MCDVMCRECSCACIVSGDYVFGAIFNLVTLFQQTAATSMSSPQAAIQQDWENREFIETLTAGIKRIAEFLNGFGHHISNN